MSTNQADQSRLAILGISSFKELRRLSRNKAIHIVLLAVSSFCAVLALAVFLHFDDKWDLGLFRVLVIMTFTTMPAAMYYVFIVSKKSSLFQEFVSNLSRLGLLKHRPGKATTEEQCEGDRYFNCMRVLSYLDRFEGVYGPIGGQLKIELLKAVHCALPDIQDRIKDEKSEGGMFSPATGIPVFIATFLIGLGWVQFIPPLGSGEPDLGARNVSWHTALLYNELPALFAFLGAYFFSLQMIYRRFVTNDLRASAFVSVSIRIALAVIGAWLLQVLFRLKPDEPSNETLLVLAFVIGVFPPVLWQILRDITSKLLMLGHLVPSLDSDLPLSELDGLTIWHQTRLEEEDIENTHNMATADIISLLVNTKIPPERIVGWIDQAILYSCISHNKDFSSGSQVEIKSHLSNLGIRSASALKAAVKKSENSDSGNPDFHDQLQGVYAHSVVASLDSFSNLKLIESWREQPTYLSTHSEGETSLSVS